VNGQEKNQKGRTLRKIEVLEWSKEEREPGKMCGQEKNQNKRKMEKSGGPEKIEKEVIFNLCKDCLEA
jgi:hypothetical protein